MRIEKASIILFVIYSLFNNILLAQSNYELKSYEIINSAFYHKDWEGEKDVFFNEKHNLIDSNQQVNEDLFKVFSKNLRSEITRRLGTLRLVDIAFLKERKNWLPVDFDVNFTKWDQEKLLPRIQLTDDNKDLYKYEFFYKIEAILFNQDYALMIIDYRGMDFAQLYYYNDCKWVFVSRSTFPEPGQE